MDNVKKVGFYLEKIIKDIKFLIEHTENMTLIDIQDDEVLLDCIMFRLVQISENSAKLTEDFKRAHSRISWAAIRGLRNRLVHDYGEVDLTIVYDTVKTDIPKLLNELQ